MNLAAQSQGLLNIDSAFKDNTLTVTCVGAGYVGALTAITMAVKNPKVQFIVCDINQSLIDRWNKGTDLPFYEPQLDDYYRQTMCKGKNLTFTTDVNHAMKAG